MGNISAMSMTQKTVVGLPKTKDNVGDFSVTPEPGWGIPLISTDRTTSMTVKAKPNQIDSMAKSLEGKIDVNTLQHFKKTGQLEVFVSPQEAKEIQQLKKDNWNVTFTYDGTALEY